MSDNPIRHLLEPIETELAALIEKREALIGPLTQQIEQLEIAVAALKAAEKAALALANVKPGSLMPRNNTLLAKVSSAPYLAPGLTPAQRVMRYLKEVGPADNTQIGDALAEFVESTASKSQRQIVSNAIYDLRQRGKVTMENGRISLT